MKKFFGVILPIILTVAFLAGGGFILYKTITMPQNVIYKEAQLETKAKKPASDVKYQLEETPEMDMTDDAVQTGGKSSDISELEDLIDSINKQTDAD